MKKIIIITSYLIGIFLLSQDVFAISYQIQLLDYPGSRWTDVTGINDSGQVVGLYLDGEDQGGRYHGFIYTNGIYSATPDYPDADQTVLSDINNGGAIVGHFSGPGGSFILQNGVFTPIVGANVLGINESGVMVGRAVDGVRITGGLFESIIFPGANATQPNDINNLGQIVGLYAKVGLEHGFLLSGDSFTTVDFPEAFRTGIQGINDAGDLVGFYQDASYNTSHGFIFSNGAYTTFDIPSYAYTTLTGINNFGQIVGVFGTGQRDWGFLATPCSSCSDNVFLDFQNTSPVPEPASIFLFATGMVGLTCFKFIRKK